MATSSACRTLTEIPDHLVTEIFLRLPAAEDLARASAACTTFRRLVFDTDGSFLRRFRRLHDLPLLGFFDPDGFHPALPPHPSAAAARALAAAAADFSLSFLPNQRDWHVQDIREGRLLLLRPAEGRLPQVSMELVVCDPLHMKYVLLPPIPDDLVDFVAHPGKPWCEAFLVPMDEEVEAAFSVIWMVHFDARLAALVFSSSTGQWQAAASKEWRDLFVGQGKPTMVSPITRDSHERHYACGCFYWESTMMGKKELLVLDTRTMEFSISDLPCEGWSTRGLTIVEAGEGRLGLYGILETSPGKFDLCYYIKGNIGESSSPWQLEKTIPLGIGCHYDIRAATRRYLLLGKFGDLRFVDSTLQLPNPEYISVDVKTLQLDTVCSEYSGFGMSNTWIYANFPPSLSSPTI